MHVSFNHRQRLNPCLMTTPLGQTLTRARQNAFRPCSGERCALGDGEQKKFCSPQPRLTFVRRSWTPDRRIRFRRQGETGNALAQRPARGGGQVRVAQCQWYSRTWLAALFALVTLVPITAHAQLQPPSIPVVPVDNVPDPDDDSLLMLVPLLISPNCQVPTSPQFSNGQPLYAGQVITLSVFCSHSPPNYVWSLNGVVIANATTATITFTVPSGMSSAVFTATTANGARP